MIVSAEAVLRCLMRVMSSAQTMPNASMDTC